MIVNKKNRSHMIVKHWTQIVGRIISLIVNWGLLMVLKGIYIRVVWGKFPDYGKWRVLGNPPHKGYLIIRLNCFWSNDSRSNGCDYVFCYDYLLLIILGLISCIPQPPYTENFFVVWNCRHSTCKIGPYPDFWPWGNKEKAIEKYFNILEKILQTKNEK